MEIKKFIDIDKTTENEAPHIVNWLLKKDTLRGFPLSCRKEVIDAVRIWMDYAKRGCSLTAFYKKKPVGCVNLYINEVEKLKHHCLFVIIVEETMRGKGIGTILLEEVIHLAKNTFQIEFLHLEVYEHNPAYHLYKKHGFIQYGCHPNYLKDENGIYYKKILMQKVL